jgi:hypothetical protein
MKARPTPALTLTKPSPCSRVAGRIHLPTGVPAERSRSRGSWAATAAAPLCFSVASESSSSSVLE